MMYKATVRWILMSQSITKVEFKIKFFQTRWKYQIRIVTNYTFQCFIFYSCKFNSPIRLNDSFYLILYFKVKTFCFASPSACLTAYHLFCSSLRLPVYLFFCRSVYHLIFCYMTVCLFIWLQVCLFPTCLLSVCRNVCFTECLSDRTYVRLTVCLSDFMSTFLTVCVSDCLPTFPAVCAFLSCDCLISLPTWVSVAACLVLC
jgi:hypothetical protein